MHWRRKWQPTPVFLPGESQGRGSLVGRRLWGRTESDTTEDLAAAAAATFGVTHTHCSHHPIILHVSLSVPPAPVFFQNVSQLQVPVVT